MSEQTSPAAAAAPGARRGWADRWRRLNNGETEYDFIGRARRGFVAPAIILVASLVSFAVQGLDLSIEFRGGVSWELPAGDLDADGAETRMADLGYPEAKIQTLTGADGERRLRVEVGPLDQPEQIAVRDALGAAAGLDDPAGQVSVNSVGPRWGDEITRAAVRALIIFFIAIAVYISLRFEWRMALAGLTAVVHDVVISVGIYSIFQFTVTPATVIAFLTILGFSLYDTIVVFDKVKENEKRFLPGNRVPYADIVNLSMNQVLMRSLNTSLAAVLPVLSLLVVGSWIMGATALQDFALALLVGLATGSYSSIFIATPVLTALKERSAHYRAIKAKADRHSLASLREQAKSEQRTARARVAVGGPGDEGGTAPLVGTAPRPVAPGTVIPPRPSKSGRKR
jgi:preprotein translocase subunit SecF